MNAEIIGTTIVSPLLIVVWHFSFCCLSQKAECRQIWSGFVCEGKEGRFFTLQQVWRQHSQVWHALVFTMFSLQFAHATQDGLDHGRAQTGDMNMVIMVGPWMLSTQNALDRGHPQTASWLGHNVATGGLHSKRIVTRTKTNS